MENSSAKWHRLPKLSPLIEMEVRPSRKKLLDDEYLLLGDDRIVSKDSRQVGGFQEGTNQRGSRPSPLATPSIPDLLTHDEVGTLVPISFNIFMRDKLSQTIT